MPKVWEHIHPRPSMAMILESKIQDRLAEDLMEFEPTFYRDEFAVECHPAANGGVRVIYFFVCVKLYERRG